MITASTLESSIASLKAAKSSSPYFVGRHMRGLWLKIWIASQPRSWPRSTAFSRPPAVETCAPTNMVAILGDAAVETSTPHDYRRRRHPPLPLRPVADRRPPHRRRPHGPLQLA